VSLLELLFHTLLFYLKKGTDFKSKEKLLAHELHEFTRMVFFVFCPRITKIFTDFKNWGVGVLGCWGRGGMGEDRREEAKKRSQDW